MPTVPKMNLEDARIILQYILDNRAFVDCETMHDFYDQEMQWREHEYHEHAVAIFAYALAERDYTQPDLALDAEYVRETGMWSCALHATNRALPVTRQHATNARLRFAHIMMRGYACASQHADFIARHPEWDTAKDMVINDCLRGGD